MPGVSVLFIRLSLVYLGAGASLGAFMLLLKVLGTPTEYWGKIVQLHQSIMIHGWFQHLIFGTAYWIFPKILYQDSIQTLRKQIPLYWVLSFLELGIGMQLLSLGIVDLPQLLGYGFIFLSTLLFLVVMWQRIHSPTENL